MTVILVVIGTLGTVTKILVLGVEDLEIRGREEAILTTALLTYREECWRFEETYCHLHSSGKPSDYADVKNSQKGKRIIDENNRK